MKLVKKKAQDEEETAIWGIFRPDSKSIFLPFWITTQHP